MYSILHGRHSFVGITDHCYELCIRSEKVVTCECFSSYTYLISNLGRGNSRKQHNGEWFRTVNKVVHPTTVLSFLPLISTVVSLRRKHCHWFSIDRLYAIY